MFWFIIIIIPMLITTINIAMKTDNPSYPFVNLGINIVGSDTSLYNLADNLSNNYTNVVTINKPTKSFDKVKYYGLVVKNVWWQVFTYLWLIILPFMVIYTLVKLRDDDKTLANITISLLIFTIYLFIINLFLAIHSAVEGNTFIIIPEGLDMFQEIWVIIKSSLPYRGLYRFISWIIGLFT